MRLTLLAASFVLLVNLAGSNAAERPNIILMMSDDMGYSDLGCYGGEINTPNLNRLAEGGLRFTQFYNTGRCCPTRASLLSGLYPHQAGVGWMMTDRGYDGYRGELNNRCVTIAEALKPAGYATYAVGKWHVTKHIQPDGPKFNWPLQRGFDRYYGTITGAGSFYDPGTLTRDNTMISPFADPEYQPEQYYYTNAISDHAIRFIKEHEEQQGDKPFFMYVAYTCAHWPMHALEKDIAKYRGKYNQGYGAYREARLERMRDLGLIGSDWEMSPQKGDWKKVEHKEWEARCMEVYAAMIDNMDQNIGRIVNSLKATGKYENTLILFLQDNGGCQETVGRGGKGKRPAEATLPIIAQDAIRSDVIPKQNRAGVPTLMGPQVMPGPEDTYIAYGINWANVSNTPFREYKHFVHGGGISTPLIAHWPNGISRKGELEPQPGHLIDLMATCVDLATASYPEMVKGQAIQPMEGASLQPAFAGKSLNRQQPLFWEHEGNRAIRAGDWKLVAKENKPWELYNVKTDRTEMHDLSSQDPNRVADMSRQWDDYAKRAAVLPLGAWSGKIKPKP
jgi:arylsulfatase A-like enzyme